MPNFMQILETFDGSADDREQLEQFARDFPWEVEITDADHAADVVVDELCANAESTVDLVAALYLRAALVESARRYAIPNR